MLARRLLVALALAGCGLAVTLVGLTFGHESLYLAPVAGVLASAWYGGLPAGLLTSGSLVVALWYYALPPARSFQIAFGKDLFGLVLFGVVALLITAIIARGRRTAATLVATLWNIDDGVIVTDRHARVTFMNPVAARLTGWSPASAAGRPVAEVFRTLDAQTRAPMTDRIETMLRDSVLRESTRPGPERERLLVSADGVERPILDSGASIVDEHGARIGAVLVFRDVTERMRTVAALQEAREAAERANRLKDEFLATVSHELRTPLNAVLGWTKMLRREALGADAARRALDAVDRNASALTQIVSDLLDVSRIVTGQLRIRPQFTDAAQLVADSVEAMRPAITAKRLEADVDLVAVPRIYVDPDRLRQIVWNLLNNAIKFTPAGGRITVRVSQVASHVQIAVCDTGQGIDPALLPFVFDRFWQADGAATRSVGGLGLGLAIVRRLVEAHAGTVTAESAGADTGATFTVTLPVRAVLTDEDPESASPASPSRAIDAPSLEGIRVLAVDDQPDSLALVATALSRRGATVRTAQSADEALRLFNRDPPDVLVADIGMPGKDGYALVTELRQQRGGALLPAIALTAYANVTDRQAALDAGFVEHVGKPVDPDRLAAIIAGLGRRPVATP